MIFDIFSSAFYNRMDLTEVQKAIVNLDVLSKLTKTDQLTVDPNGLLEIDTRYFRNLRRWQEGTTREGTLSHIHTQINWVHGLLANESPPEVSTRAVRMRIHSAMEGLRCHLEHYADVHTRARIQLVIDILVDLSANHC